MQLDQLKPPLKYVPNSGGSHWKPQLANTPLDKPQKLYGWGRKNYFKFLMVSPRLISKSNLYKIRERYLGQLSSKQADVRKINPNTPRLTTWNFGLKQNWQEKWNLALICGHAMQKCLCRQVLGFIWVSDNWKPRWQLAPSQPKPKAQSVHFSCRSHICMCVGVSSQSLIPKSVPIPRQTRGAIYLICSKELFSRHIIIQLWRFYLIVIFNYWINTGWNSIPKRIFKKEVRFWKLQSIRKDQKLFENFPYN